MKLSRKGVIRRRDVETNGAQSFRTYRSKDLLVSISRRNRTFSTLSLGDRTAYRFDHYDIKANTYADYSQRDICTGQFNSASAHST